MGKSYLKIKVDGRLRDIHRVKMEEYLGRKLDRDEVVHHCNGDIKDNLIENLELMLLSVHTRMHKKGNGYSVGDKHPRRKLNREKVLQIRASLSAGATAKDLAARFQVHPTLIYQIGQGKIWKEAC